MEVAIAIDKLRETTLGNLDVGTFFYILESQSQRAVSAVGLVVQNEDGKPEYVVFGGTGAFQLRSRDGSKERKVLPLHKDRLEVFVKFDSAQTSAAHPRALGALLVSGDGAAVMVERKVNNGMEDVENQHPLRLVDSTVLGALRNDCDVFCLDKWSLVFRDANGKDSVLFQAE